ncbi:MAG: hexose kinase [Mycobacterium sp.]
MIITVTPNPGLDLTYTFAVVPESASDVHRAIGSTLEASGKGVNVSRALATVGVPTCAILPAGGATGRALVELLDDDGVDHRVTRQSGETRVNTTALHPGGGTVKLNGPGAPLRDSEQRALLREIALALADAQEHAVIPLWVAICGSLPPGVGSEFIEEMIALVHGQGAKCAVDVSGDALAAALCAGADLLAPNRQELAEVTSAGQFAGSLEQLAAEAKTLSARTGAQLLISLGADGALYADGSQVLHGWGPPLIPVNTAGAGDALLAGWLVDEAEPKTRLARAIAWGRSACLAATTVDPRPGSAGATPITLTELAAQPPS